MFFVPALLAALLDARGTRAKASAQGRLREALGLENVTIEVLCGGDGWATIVALSGEERVGFLILNRRTDWPRGEDEDALLCRSLTDAARAAVGPSFSGWFSVSESKVNHRYRGRGIGRRLYEAGLRYAAERGGALVSDNVYGGNTSGEAAAVWQDLLFSVEGGWAHLPAMYETAFWAVDRPVDPARRPVVSPTGWLLGPGEVRSSWRRGR